MTERMMVGILQLDNLDVYYLEEQLVQFATAYPVRPWSMSKEDVIVIPGFQGFCTGIPAFGRYEIPNAFFPNWSNMAQRLWDDQQVLTRRRKTLILAEGNAACLYYAAAKRGARLEITDGAVRPLKEDADVTDSEHGWRINLPDFVGFEAFPSVAVLRKYILEGSSAITKRLEDEDLQSIAVMS